MLPCFFLDRRGFPLASLPNMPYLSHIFLIVLSWTLLFNMLTEACGACGEVLGSSAISLSVTRSDFGVNLLGCLLLGGLVSVLNVFHLWIIFSTVEWWTSICLDYSSQIDGSNNCFSKIIADVLTPWHCVNTHLKAPDQQTAKTSAFIEVLTLADDQLIKGIRLAVSDCYLPS